MKPHHGGDITRVSLFSMPLQRLVLSPENSVCNTFNAPLNFTVNEPFSKVAYSLDGQDNVIITGNTTLSELPNGSHNLKVCATDELGNTGFSEIVLFSVEVPFSNNIDHCSRNSNSGKRRNSFGLFCKS